MNSNFVECRSRVIIEDVDVGPFETFDMSADPRTFGETAVLTIPLFAIGVERGSDAYSRIRTVFKDNVVKPTAEISVYCWYTGMEEVCVFHGFIEHVTEGYPTKLYLRDSSFILRFGEMQAGWTGDISLQKIVEDCIPVAQEAFSKEREYMGFTRAVPELRYDTTGDYVQALTSPISFNNFAIGRAPYEVIQYLQQLLVLYAGVDNENRVFIGANSKDTKRPIIKLSTTSNVIERDITTVDGRFVGYDVKITGILKNGKQYTATGGLRNTRTRAERGQLEAMLGESYRAFTTLDTVEAIQAAADRQLQMLKGFRNKGKLMLLMYPKMQLLDSITYEDTIFPKANGSYYVMGYNFKANDSGFFQTINITDKVFMI